VVQTLFYDLLYSGRAFKGVIQRFGNICSKVGEYANDVMLICPIGGPVQCMPFPAVSHQRNRYHVVMQVSHHALETVGGNVSNVYV
jgi:hypothetical protein